jgi:hypothetical protein
MALNFGAFEASTSPAGIGDTGEREVCRSKYCAIERRMTGVRKNLGEARGPIDLVPSGEVD